MIRGIVPVGTQVDHLKHLLCTESGRVSQHSVKSSKVKELLNVLGEMVKCVKQNSNLPSMVAFGSKD